MPNMSPSASSEEIWELLTCNCIISWFGFSDPQNGSVYAIQFSTESDEAWAHNIFLLSQLEDCESPARELLKAPQPFLQ